MEAGESADSPLRHSTSTLPVYLIVSYDDTIDDLDPKVESYLAHSHMYEPTYRDPTLDDVPVSLLRDPETDETLNMCSVVIPDIGCILPSNRGLNNLPEPILALHRMSMLIQELNVTTLEAYDIMALSEPSLSSDLPPRAHCDGGAMATTTNRRDYIFGYWDFTDEERLRVPRLCVADNSVYRPQGSGYLQLPIDGSGQSMFIHTYYTPEIPATIMSPDNVAKSYGCKGYGTFSDFAGDSSSLHLVSC